MPTQPIKNARASVPAIYDESAFDREDCPAGRYQFADGYDGTKDVALLFGCPCGCGALQSVHLKPYGGGQQHIWNWDGWRDCPTLTPSILIYQLNDKGERIGEHWHGYLTNAEFISC